MIEKEGETIKEQTRLRGEGGTRRSRGTDRRGAKPGAVGEVEHPDSRR